MSYRDFTFPGVVRELSLTFDNVQLFPDVTPVEVRPEWLRTLQHGTRIAQAVATEKAKSELIIAPILLEVMGLLQDRYSIFSGIDFNVDPAAGLNGYCDFLIARSPILFLVKAPVVAVAEAKNENLQTGLALEFPIAGSHELNSFRLGVDVIFRY